VAGGGVRRDVFFGMQRSRALLPLLVLLVVCLAASCLCAQTSASAAQQIAGPANQFSQLPVRVPDAGDGLIQINVVAANKSGEPVAGLEQKNFTLLDSNRPQKILSFHAFDGKSMKSELPVEVVLLIDTVGEPSKLASEQRQGVEEFLRQNGGHLTHPVSIFRLSDAGLWMLAQPSSDGNALAAEAFDNDKPQLIRSARGDKSADPPSLLALKALGAVAILERQKPGRKLLIWIGPGWGTGSATRFDGAMDGQHLFDAIVWFSTLLREAEITLYSISAGRTDDGTLHDGSSLEGVKSGRHANFGSLDRKVLALQSGGRVLGYGGDLPNQTATSALAAQIENCVEEARAFYTLSFDPEVAAHANEYHELKVLVAKPGLEVRTNGGYYDQPAYSDQPHLPARQVTVVQLEQLLNADRGKLDGELADELYELDLTERLNGQKLSTLTAGLRGPRARRALVVLADSSAFLDPPPAEISAQAPPDLQAQERMISLAVDYKNKAFLNLPNLFATQITDRYEETPQRAAARDRQLESTSTEPMGQSGIAFRYGASPVPGDQTRRDAALDYQPLHLVASTSGDVLYRNGDEVVDSGSEKAKDSKTPGRYLIAHGTFGPILATVMMDAVAARSGMTWSRWEQIAGRPVAVFHYVVPREKSHYQVEYCCRLDSDGTVFFRKRTGYHGEIAIDPASGAILRLTQEADLKPFVPMARTYTMVEYAPVEIGGSPYICPIRSITVARHRTMETLNEWDERFTTFGPFITILNDVSFKDYHMFRVHSHVLPDSAPDL
jgi:VWFA-related protein